MQCKVSGIEPAITQLQLVEKVEGYENEFNHYPQIAPNDDDAVDQELAKVVGVWRGLPRAHKNMITGVVDAFLADNA